MIKDFLQSDAIDKHTFIQNKKLHRKKTYLSLFLLWIIFLSLSIIAFFTFYFSNPSRTIRHVTVTGYKHTTPTEIILALNPMLNTKYLGTIPVNNYLFFPREITETYLMESFPGISSVSFSFENDTLFVGVYEKSINSLVCNLASKDSENEQCYFLDHFARAYGAAPKISVGLYKKFYVNQKDFIEFVQTKEPIFSIEEFENLESTIHDLELKNSMMIDSVVLDDERFSMKFHIYRMNDWYPKDLYIKFSFITINSEHQATTLLGLYTFFNKIIMSDGDIARMYDIEYIDCRFVNKILYKRKTGNEEEIKV